MGRKKCRTKAPVELVQCPVCDMTMRMTTLDMHFDTCLKRKEQQQRLEPGGHGGGASPEQQLAGPNPLQVQLQQQADEDGTSSKLASLYYESGVSGPGGHVGGRVGGHAEFAAPCGHRVARSRWDDPAGHACILPCIATSTFHPLPHPPTPSGLPAARPPTAAAQRARRRRPATQAPADRGAFAPAGLASAPCNE